MPADCGRAMGFRLGINYWPASTAMRWWSDFDAAEFGLPTFRRGEQSTGELGSMLVEERAAAAVTHRGLERVAVADDRPWIDIAPEEFYLDDGSHLARLYRRYRASHPATRSGD